MENAEVWKIFLLFFVFIIYFEDFQGDMHRNNFYFRKVLNIFKFSFIENLSITINSQMYIVIDK